MDFCYKTADAWQIVGYGLLILKILIPIILIIFGAIDLGKAILSSDNKTIKDSAIKFVKRIIAGITIFFVPTLINVFFDLITEFTSDIESDYKNCVDCLTSPNNECDTSYQENIFE